MLTHPAEETLINWLELGTMPEPGLINHLESCAICQQRLNGLLAEAAEWQAGLALTGAEQRQVLQANLAERLVEAVQAERRQRLGQLLLLASLCLTLGLGWLTVTGLAESTWLPTLRSINLLDLLLTFGLQLGGPPAIVLAQLLAQTTGLTGRLLLLLLASLLLVGLWFYRRQPTPSDLTLLP